MIRTTYIVEQDFGALGRRDGYLSETRVGTTFSEVVDNIVMGQYDAAPVLSVYKLDGERIEDVSSDVCADILRYVQGGGRISESAAAFLDWCGFDLPSREAA